MTKHASMTGRLAERLERLLSLKTGAQYAPYRFVHDEAELAIDLAQQLLDGALKIVP
jgi:hypothetical protein